jgi:hypothetical protein
MLAGRQCGENGFFVHLVGRANVHNIDVFPLNQLSIIPRK